MVAPIDGRVSRARITPGNIVQGGSGGESTLLTTVVTTTPVYVYFNIDERALLQYEQLLRRGGKDPRPTQLQDAKIPVEIGLATEEGFPHRGHFDFMDNKVDATTGTIRARGVFDNTRHYLTPGLFVRVRVPFGEPHPSLLISERALGINQKQKFLLTVNRKNVVEYRQVQVGSVHDGLRAIESGIQPDDLVVVNGLMRARPGIVVAPQVVPAGGTAGDPAKKGRGGDVRQAGVDVAVQAGVE